MNTWRTIASLILLFLTETGFPLRLEPTPQYPCTIAQAIETMYRLYKIVA